MANAAHDQNDRPTIICASNTDGVTIVPILANPSNHGIKVNDSASGSENGNNQGNAMLDENGVPVWVAESSTNDGSIIEVYGSSGMVLINSL